MKCLSFLIILSCACCYSLPAGHKLGIWGGETVDITSRPYLVSVEIQGNLACSGSILTSGWIITVASCVYGVALEDIQVRSGSKNISKSGQVRSIVEINIHEKFSPITNDHDIATLKLSTPLKLNKYTWPIRTALEPVKDGDKLRVSGWGVDQKDVVGNLKQVKLIKLSAEECQSKYSQRNITENMICGWKDSSDAPCWDDFGDPLVNSWNRLVGIFSWSKNCTEYPSVYTDVQFYKSWLSSKTS